MSDNSAVPPFMVQEFVVKNLQNKTKQNRLTENSPFQNSTEHRASKDCRTKSRPIRNVISWVYHQISQLNT